MFYPVVVAQIEFVKEGNCADSTQQLDPLFLQFELFLVVALFVFRIKLYAEFTMSMNSKGSSCAASTRSGACPGAAR